MITAAANGIGRATAVIMAFSATAAFAQATTAPTAPVTPKAPVVATTGVINYLFKKVDADTVVVESQMRDSATGQLKPVGSVVLQSE